MGIQPIYTELSNCRDCYRCVRSCPVDAIQIQDSHAELLYERCTFCGICVKECPSGVMQIRNDTDPVRMALMSDRKVVVSLSPSYASEYQGLADNYIRALRRLGFDTISETAIGAHLVSEALDLYMNKHGKAPFISTACTSTVQLVRKHFPERLKELAPIPSPLQTHCAYLRHLYGDDIVIVYVGPCISRKLEADETPGYPDIALTFREVEDWLKEDNIRIESIDTGISTELLPAKAGRSALFPMEKGQIETSEIWRDNFIDQSAISVSGADRLISTLKGDSTDYFLESLYCDGGCINGPAAKSTGSAALRKKAVTSFVASRLQDGDFFKGDPEFAAELLDKGYGMIKAEQPKEAAVSVKTHSESEIDKALLLLGKKSEEDELDCGACGYDSCREMAMALLNGTAELEMCVSRMRQEAESKVDALLSNSPQGVVIVDRDLTIVDCNKRFIDLFEDFPASFLDSEGLKSFRGTPISAFVPFSEKFQEQFSASKPTQYRFKHDGRIMRIIFFLVKGKDLLGAMFEDITTRTVRRESVVSKAETVISQSLNTVQQIASLLGESAAEQEILLNSIIEEFNVRSDGSGYSSLVEESEDA